MYISKNIALNRHFWGLIYDYILSINVFINFVKRSLIEKGTRNKRLITIGIKYFY